MLHFPVLRTNRLVVQLKELSIGDSIKLAAMPEHLKESGRTVFLNAAIDTVQGEENPLLWTVQERLLVTAHYLSVVTPDGPNFSIGEEAKFLDYVDFQKDISKKLQCIEIGDIAGDQWQITHLNGGMVEAIDRLQGEFQDVSNRMYWLLGSMAAQLYVKGNSQHDVLSGDYDQSLLTQIKILSDYPESEFENLVMAFEAGRKKLQHLLFFDFNDNEIVALPKEGGGNLPPATFPFYACLSQFAKDMV